MSYLDHIAACNRHDMDHYRPFLVADQQVGWVRAENLVRLAAFGEAFEVQDEQARLRRKFDSFEARTEVVNDVLCRLAGEQGIPTLRGEHYPVVRDWGEPPLMSLDRAAVPFFGIRAFGVHMNGFVRKQDGLHLWIGRRAADKHVAPNQLDNIVAGGQPIGLGLAENLCKEAAEEADIPESLCRRAVSVGALTYCMENEQGLKPDTLFVYDLELPEDFIPRNTDGEIAEFMLWPVDRVAQLVRETCEFKFNVNLVLIDFLIRHGFITPENEPDYLKLVTGLRRAAFP